MNELQFYHWIATGALTCLLTILWWWIRGVSDDMKAKLSREEFKSFMEDIVRSRTEFRDNFIKLFEKSEQHEKFDAARFEILTRDFNGGLNRLAEKISDNHIQVLTKLNDKQDRG